MKKGKRETLQAEAQTGSNLQQEEGATTMKQARGVKLFFGITLWGLLLGILCVKIPITAAATSDKHLLTQADFKYIGAFAMPATIPSGGDPSFGKGLALRYVNGELHMFSGAWNPQSIYEVRVPTPSTGTPPVATVVKDYGDNWWNTAYTGSGAKQLFGLYWDEPDKRLYWSYGDIYNASNGDDPSIGYSTLNDATGALTPVGSYRFTGRGPKSTMSCIVPIPQWFADAYTGSKRLGAGCGGYWSIIGVGGVSMGPALAAFSPPNSADRSALAFTNLVGYPFTATIYGPPDRGHRNTNYTGGPDWLVWPAQNSIGYWTAGDALYQAGVWIDLAGKHGVIYFPTLSTGLVHYINSSIEGGGSEDWWLLYDPADLAKVAQGKNQWEVQPVAAWRDQYPGLSAGGPWRDLPGNLITGAAFDSIANRLYVAVQLAAPGGVYGTTKVYVYEVQSGPGTPTDTIPPEAPGTLRMR